MSVLFRRVAIFVVLLVTFATALSIVVPIIATRYLNAQLQQIEGYRGSIASVQLRPFSGSYAVTDLVLNKIEADSPVPFVAIPRIDLRLQWRNLIRGAIVGEVDITRPQLNFSKGKTEKGNQFGTEVSWVDRVQELTPIEINRLLITGGKVQYLDSFSSPKVDIALDQLELEARNLKNVDDKDNPLPSTVSASAISVGSGELKMKGRINLLKSVPDFDFNASLEKVDLIALNDFLKAYVNVDAESGNFNLYTELVASDAALDGYVKPLITNLKVLSLENDSKQALQLVWEAAVGFVSEVFENQKKDQLGSKVPIAGRIDDPDIGVFTSIVQLLTNAFVEALKSQTDGDISFETEE